MYQEGYEIAVHSTNHVSVSSPQPAAPHRTRPGQRGGPAPFEPSSPACSSCPPLPLQLLSLTSFPEPLPPRFSS